MPIQIIFVRFLQIRINIMLYLCKIIPFTNNNYHETSIVCAIIALRRA